MLFKEFISRQRVGVFFIGVISFSVFLLLAHSFGYDSIPGALFVDLAASAVTVVFTALVLDYLNVQEKSARTKNVAGLAEDEIKATCFRIKLRMARLLGFKRQASGRSKLSTRQQAQSYLDTLTHKVDYYLASTKIDDTSLSLDVHMFKRYMDRLELAQKELEQTLMLYESALSFSLRERVLGLRSELHVANHLFGFIDFNDSLTKDNISLIRIMSQGIYEAIEVVLDHDSRVLRGTSLNAKDSLLSIE